MILAGGTRPVILAGGKRPVKSASLARAGRAMLRCGRVLVAGGSALAVAGAVHSVINAQRLRRAPAGDDAGSPAQDERQVPVLIPARDEADKIGDCVRAAAQQAAAEVVVLDDCSTDATAARAEEAGGRVLRGSRPPEDWLGKPWACAQLAAATDTDVLVFVDADVRLQPGAVARALRLLDESGLDVIFPFPRQVCASTAERLVQPLLQWSWLTTLPLRLAETSPRPSLSAACGQFIVIRRSALDRIGGFAAVRSEVLDDLALVRLVKAAGGRGGVVDGTSLASCRMYAGWDELRAGYGKSLWSALGSPARAAALLSLLGVVYVAPPLAAIAGSRVGLIGYLGAVASRVVAARRTQGRWLPDAAVHPLSILAFAWLTTGSIREHRRGTLTWKGRPLAPALPA